VKKRSEATARSLEDETRNGERNAKTREFQTQLLHYFSKGDNKSNHHQIEILNGGEILVNCTFKFNKNLFEFVRRYLGIQIQSKSQFNFVP
jgi:hypothetical protein